VAIRIPRILITDDDQGFREILRGLLERHGYATLEADSGERALEIVRREAVHLLLLDMYMPKLTGLETIRRVKQMRAVLPCILMSADADEQLVRQADSVQAFSVLSKPMSASTVTQAIRNAMSRAYNWPNGDLPDLATPS